MNAILRMSKENSREICQMLCFPWYEWILKRREFDCETGFEIVFWKPKLQFRWLSVRQRKWEDLVTTNYQCLSSMGCSSQCRSKVFVEMSQKHQIFVEKWKWKCRPPGIFPLTWRSSAPLSAASQFWPTDEKLRKENLVQGSGLELFVLNVLYCLIVSSSPLFIGPESDHCRA